MQKQAFNSQYPNSNSSSKVPLNLMLNNGSGDLSQQNLHLTSPKFFGLNQSKSLNQTGTDRKGVF